MKKQLLALGLVLSTGAAFATKYLKKPVVSAFNGATLAVKTNVDEPSVVAGTINSGTANTNVTAQEGGSAFQHITTLSFNDITLPAIAGAGNVANGLLLYTLPAGAQGIESIRFNVSLQADNGQVLSDTPDVGVGTVKAGGAVAVLSGTGTFENILTGQTFTDVNGTVAKTIGLDVGLSRDTSEAKTIYLNYADGWANGSNLTANGAVIIEWSHFE